MLGSPVFVVKVSPPTPIQSPISSWSKIAAASGPTSFAWRYTWILPVLSERSKKWLFPMLRWAVIRPAVRTGVPSTKAERISPGRPVMSKRWP